MMMSIGLQKVLTMGALIEFLVANLYDIQKEVSGFAKKSLSYS